MMYHEIQVTPGEVEELTRVIGDKLQNVRAPRDPVPYGEALMYRQIPLEAATPLNGVYKQLTGTNHPGYLRAGGMPWEEKPDGFQVPEILIVHQWVIGELKQLCEKDKRLYRFLIKLESLK